MTFRDYNQKWQYFPETVFVQLGYHRWSEAGSLAYQEPKTSLD